MKKQIIMGGKIMECEDHELQIVDENWIGENSLMVIAECQKCQSKFRGLMIKDETKR